MRRHKQRLENIEKKLGDADGGYPSLRLWVDKTKHPAEYWDGDNWGTGKKLTESEAEKLKEDFCKGNAGKDYCTIVQIGITNTKITDSSE